MKDSIFNWPKEGLRAGATGGEAEGVLMELFSIGKEREASAVDARRTKEVKSLWGRRAV